MGSMIMPAAEAEFEIQGIWFFQFDTARTTDYFHSGAYSLRLQQTLPSGHGGFARWVSPTLANVGDAIVFGGWVRLESGSGGPLYIYGFADSMRATIEVDPSGLISYRNENYDIVEQETVPDPSAWFKVLFSYAVETPSYPTVILFHQSLSATRWLVDDFVFQSGNMITKEIFDDAVLDLQAVNGTGIFTTAFDAVYSEPTTQAVRLAKTAEITPLAGGDDDSLSVGDRARGGIQRYGIKVQIRSGTPRADIQTAIDDVRNALQRSTSNIKSAKTAGTVEDISIEWDEPMTSEDISVRVAEAALTLTVKYTFTAGAA